MKQVGSVVVAYLLFLLVGLTLYKNIIFFQSDPFRFMLCSLYTDRNIVEIVHLHVLRNKISFIVYRLYNLAYIIETASCGYKEKVP